MVRRTPPTPTADAPDPTDAAESDATREPAFDRIATTAAGPDLAAFPVIGLTRRRMAGILGVALAAWIVVVFARQVSDASAATNRAEGMVLSNAARRSEIAALEREFQQIGQARYVQQQARAHGLGTPREIAFTLDPDAPPLPADAPGSAANRVGAPASVSPLERWLTLLFGPSD